MVIPGSLFTSLNIFPRQSYWPLMALELLKEARDALLERCCAKHKDRLEGSSDPQYLKS